MDTFSRRVARLPFLGLGVSTEYGAQGQSDTLDAATLHGQHPEFAAFLEVGAEVAKGADAATAAWVRRGLPTTYHFLDINLDDPDDFDAAWLDGTRALIAQIQPAWLCGDAGLWHFGARARGQMLLLPPILTDESATATAQGVARLREATGLEVLPENPPGHAFVGDLHILDFFTRVAERADTGLLLDVAHLAMFQHARGHEPCFGLDACALDRVVEVHVAGGTWHTVEGYSFIEDSHSTDILPATWEIFEYVLRHAPNLRAVIFECERNPTATVIPGFARIHAAWRAAVGQA